MPDLFKDGTLEMSTSPLEKIASDTLWQDCIVNRAALIVTLILLLLELTDIIRLYPSLLRCIPLWKGNLELEHSVSLARTRNTIAFIMGLCICLIADRWALVAPSFKTALPAAWQLAVTTGLLAGTLLLRRLLFYLTKFRSTTSEYASTFRHIIFNYMVILLGSLMLLTVVLLVAARVNGLTVRNILYAEAALFYLLHLVRTGQFLRSRCGVLSTILYLCALEIMPAGILIFVCTI